MSYRFDCAILGGIVRCGQTARTALAMRSLESELIRRDLGWVLLFWPPFDQLARDPGYIGGYPPGLRENGGQYSHAACGDGRPTAWSGFEANIEVAFTHYTIHVKQAPERHLATPQTHLDGEMIACDAGKVRVPLSMAPGTIWHWLCQIPNPRR